MKGWAVLPLIVLGQMALAAGPDSSQRPVPRDNGTTLPVIVVPSGAIEQPKRDPAARAAAEGGRGIKSSLRPSLRSRKVEKAARARQQMLAKGAVCGDLAIQGAPVGRVAGKISGCGIENAVKVRAVSGIKLSNAAVMDCTTAKALDTWVRQSAVPALAGQGGGLKELRVAAHYACRTRNNRKGGKISEHGKGRAIDISGFELADGSTITVLKGWRARRSSKALRRMHRGACGPFGTVLGPESDRFHQDHFHFDTARYRSGSYCR
ncbi:MAG: extensin family protein [Sulfitobacter dubius]